MAVETRPNNAAGRAWLAAEEAAGSYMLVNEKFISKLTGSDLPTVASSRTITTEDFRDRFTPAEMLAVASSDDPVVKFALLKLSTKALPYVDLDNAEVISTMAHLVTIGLLTPERSAAIQA